KSARDACKSGRNRKRASDVAEEGGTRYITSTLRRLPPHPLLATMAPFPSPLLPLLPLLLRPCTSPELGADRQAGTRAGRGNCTRVLAHALPCGYHSRCRPGIGSLFSALYVTAAYSARPYQRGAVSGASDLFPDEGTGEGGLRSSPVREYVSEGASIWAIPA